MLELPKFYEGLKAFELVWAERLRQKEVEGYTPAHDDSHTEGQLAVLAAGYTLSSRGPNYTWLVSQVASVLKAAGWPFKPSDPIRDLTRAGALILAELERRLRRKDAGWCSQCGSLLTARACGPTHAMLANKRRLRAEEKNKMPEHMELPRWQSHKVVTAAKITFVDMAGREDGPEGTIMLKVIAADGQEVVLDVESKVFSRGVPDVGDYFVRYDDNYKSWSPAEAFEKGYTRLP